MSDVAFQTQYRQEFIAGFEQHQSLLRQTVTTDAVIKGNQAVFLVADSGGAVATTRGVNGLITARPDNNTQNTCLLQEWHDLVRKTDFNVFASQGDQRGMMQMTSMAVMNRKVDSLIIAELATATHTAGATAVTGSIALLLKASTILQNNAVPNDSNLTLVATPAMVAYLMQAPEFASADYVGANGMPFSMNDPAWRDQSVAYRWLNFLIIVHPNLTGKGTSAEVCFMFHKNAIGCAMDTAGIETPVGYFEEQAYSWARVSAHMGVKMLQQSGVLQINHDGSAYVGT